MSIMARTVQHFAAKKAARQITTEILPLGIEKLKFLAQSGRSIIATYLNGCSEERKRQLRTDYNGLLRMGVTLEMILDKVAKQIPELEPLIKGMDSYRKAEIERVMAFLRGA